jgi:hypothetical protein
MTEISPGKIYVLWELVGILSRQKLRDVNPSDLVNALDNSSFPAGGLSLIKESIDDGLALQLFSFDDGRLVLSETTINIFTPLLNQTDGIVFFIRGILHQILVSQKPPWIIFFDLDAHVFSEYIPAIWIDLLEAGTLLNLDDIDVLAWWEKIIIELQQAEKAKKEEVGRMGEMLTVQYEKNRLTLEGYLNVNHLVKWASKISDNYGYDVRSIFGKLLDPAKASDHIQIEVKASQSDDETNFRFYV